jgi:hypothetical protein
VAAEDKNDSRDLMLGEESGEVALGRGLVEDPVVELLGREGWVAGGGEVTAIDGLFEILDGAIEIIAVE